MKGMESGSGPSQLERRCGDIKANLERVLERVAGAASRAGRDPTEVTIVAVSKAFHAEVVRAGVEAGLREIGENRVQEARGKRSLLADLTGVRWHLVGHLQRNKAKLALSLFDVIHSLDSRRLAEALNRHAETLGRVVPVLLEVNVAGEETKFGFSLADEGRFFSTVEQILPLPHLRLDGLMTVAPFVPDPETVRPVFRQLWRLREALRRRYPAAGWCHLSMGMTEDFEVAVEEGATLIRLGRALFGARPGQLCSGGSTWTSW
jgi:pyridoxal phosphate enzyme (YggS family)